MHGSGGYAAEWHDTADGKFEWKGDSSSDEICSHFYAITLFLEHAAQGEEIPQARQYLARVANHLIDHGWQLVDLDGKPPVKAPATLTLPFTPGAAGSGATLSSSKPVAR